MITSRPITPEDIEILQKALDQNDFHPDQKTEYYTNVGVTDVYENEQGPIGFLRYTKALRLCTVWTSNADRERNAASIIQAIFDAVQKARANGYSEIIFETTSPKLSQFCADRLGFEKATGDTMVLYVKG
jgi:hypothetical protein